MNGGTRVRRCLRVMDKGALSPDEFLLLVAGLAYLLIAGSYALWQVRFAESLLRGIREDESSSLWESLGAPGSMRDAVKDPQMRFRNFMRNKAYLHSCRPGTVKRIERFKRQTSIGLALLALAAVGLLVRFWPVFKPHLFPG